MPKLETLSEKLKHVKWADKTLLLYRHSIHQESFRGGLMIAAAHLEECLLQLLVNFMIPEKEVLRLFQQRQPLGDFGSKIDVSFGFGVISQKEKHDLHIIRKMRNAVAHSHTLEDEMRSLEDQAKNLIFRVEGIENGEDMAVIVDMAVTLLLMRLSMRLKRVQAQKPVPEINDGELVVDDWD